ncbi:MAG: hypothetical protein J6X03_02385 [Bacilli bacterium]|nr:hypothetical protein [Bacilli bacterium]
MVKQAGDERTLKDKIYQQSLTQDYNERMKKSEGINPLLSITEDVVNDNVVKPWQTLTSSDSNVGWVDRGLAALNLVGSVATVPMQLIK